MKKMLQNKSSWSLTVRDVAYIGIMIATLEAAKLSLSFIPNVELVTFLLILYTLAFGKKVLYAAFAFVGVECLIWGMGIWVIMYLYIWPLLCILTLFLKKQRSAWFWAVFSGIYGLMFGGLCSLVYLGFGGIKTAFAWWIAGIPYDILHGISNFVLMLILYLPIPESIRQVHLGGKNVKKQQKKKPVKYIILILLLAVIAVAGVWTAFHIKEGRKDDDYGHQ